MVKGSGLQFNPLHSPTIAYGQELTTHCRVFAQVGVSQRVAAAAALAASLTKRQVRLPVERHADSRMGGGRCAVLVTYDAAWDAHGRVAAIDMDVLLEGGAFADSTWVEVVGLAHHIDNVSANSASSFASSFRLCHSACTAAASRKHMLHLARLPLMLLFGSTSIMQPRASSHHQTTVCSLLSPPWRTGLTLNHTSYILANLATSYTSYPT